MGVLLGDRAGRFQQLDELTAGLETLQIRVAADVLLGDVDVGDCALAADLLEGVLHLVAVGC